ncbi:MAG: GLUG motif-containing protein [Planctomycetota bacterium]
MRRRQWDGRRPIPDRHGRRPDRPRRDPRRLRQTPADIDLSGYAGADFKTIGYWRDREYNAPFSGVFDGKHHTISNFTCVVADANHVGLFGYVDGEEAEIRDLGLIDPNVDAAAGHAVGSLVGELWGGTISGCYVRGGTVSGGEAVGGLMGYGGGHWRWGAQDSTIVGCYAITNVIGLERVGGLVGRNDGTTVSGCYSTGSVSGVEFIGGLVGQNGNWHHVIFETIFIYGSIDHCYSNCDVTGVATVGGLVGLNCAGEITRCYSSGAVLSSEPNRPIDSKEGFFGGFVGDSEVGIEDGFWDIEASGLTVSAGGTGKTTAQMQTAATFLEAGWDFVDEAANGTEDIWWILEGQDYPRLWWETGN